MFRCILEVTDSYVIEGTNLAV